MARGKKNNTMDYSTAAFRFWARKGCPTHEEAVKRIYNHALSKVINKNPKEAVTYAEAEVERASAALSDILACDTVFREFELAGKKIICDAVREIYMIQPSKPLKLNDVTYRVRAFSLQSYVSERQVYRYLAQAREAFVMVRNLRNDTEDDEW